MEAGKYDVLPLDDRTTAELVAVMPAALIPPGGVYKYYPGTIEVPEFAAANTRGRSYKILAQVEVADGEAQGVIFAQGARFGGHALFLKDGNLWYTYNFIGIPPEQQLVSDRAVGPGRHVLGVEFVKEKLGDRHETLGTAKLYIDDQVVGESAWKTQPGHFALCGEGLSIGRDSSDPVSREYAGGYDFRGGEILEVEVNVANDVYLDLERQFAAAMARD
ncbi:MAG TPA: hypothetical protein VI318_17555 [Baekduia sp.]